VIEHTLYFRTYPGNPYARLQRSFPENYLFDGVVSPMKSAIDGYIVYNGETVFAFKEGECALEVKRKVEELFNNIIRKQKLEAV
jgi:hypothetical protein